MLSGKRVIFWTCVALTFAAVLAHGGNLAFIWVPWALVVFVLYVALFLVDEWTAQARSRTTGASLIVSLVGSLYVGVLLWAGVQAFGGIAPSVSAPEWSSVASVGAISIDPMLTWHGIIRFGLYGALFLISYSACADGAVARRFMSLLCVWCGIVATYGLVAHFSGVNPLLGDSERFRELEATFSNRNAYAAYANIGLIAGVAILLRKLTRDRTSGVGPERHELRDALAAFFQDGGWIYFIAVVAIICSLLLTASRAGVVCGGVGLLTFILLYLRRRVSISKSVITVTTALTLVLILVYLTPFITRIRDHGIFLQDRALVYEAMTRAILERPWQGYGLGAFKDGFRPFVPRGLGDQEWALAHSTYLENAFELGLPAAAALTLALALLAFSCLRGAVIRRRFYEAPAFAFAVIVALGLHSVVDFPLQMPATAAVFALVLGVGCAQARPSDGGKSGTSRRRRRREHF